jgi:hypothetical protein
MLSLLPLLLQKLLSALVVEFLVSIAAGLVRRCWRLSCALKIGFGINIKVYLECVNLCMLFLQIVMKIHFFSTVDEKTKQPATFWSRLQDIQEGLQVI